MRISQSERRAALLFISPAVAILALVNIVPLIYGLWLSLHHWTLGRGAPRFAGLDNYLWLLEDTRFQESLVTTAYLVVICVVLQVTIGLGLAMLFNTKLPGLDAIRRLSILPLIVAPPVVGLLWLYFFYDKIGLISRLTEALQFAQVSYLTSKTLAIWTVAIADTWQWTPFVVAVLYAALQAIPEYVYEAARMDGLSRGQIFRWITLPLLAPALAVVTVLRALDTVRNFDLIFMMTRGGPAGKTENLSWYIFQTGFQSLDIGAASCMAIVMIALVTIAAQVVVRRLLRHG